MSSAAYIRRSPRRKQNKDGEPLKATTSCKVGLPITVIAGPNKNRRGHIAREGPEKNKYLIFSDHATHLPDQFFSVLRSSVEERKEEDDDYSYETDCGQIDNCLDGYPCFPPGSGLGHDVVHITQGTLKGYYGTLLGMHNAATYRVALYGIVGVRNIKKYRCTVLHDIPPTTGEHTFEQSKLVKHLKKLQQKQSGTSPRTCSRRDDVGQKRKNKKKIPVKPRYRTDVEAFSDEEGEPGSASENSVDTDNECSGDARGQSSAADSTSETDAPARLFRLSIVFRLAKGILGYEDVDWGEIRL